MSGSWCEASSGDVPSATRPCSFLTAPRKQGLRSSLVARKGQGCAGRCHFLDCVRRNYCLHVVMKMACYGKKIVSLVSPFSQAQSVFAYELATYRYPRRRRRRCCYRLRSLSYLAVIRLPSYGCNVLLTLFSHSPLL